MTIVLTLVFLAALAGVIKPYIGGLKRTHFLLAAIISFVFIGVGVGGDTSTNSDKGNTAAVTMTDANTNSPQPIADVPREPGSKWQYSEDRDEMRGTVTRFASIVSENEVDLDFPYGSVNGQISVRKRPKDGLAVMFSVQKGQILCSSYTDSTIAVKFDNGPVRNYECSRSIDGSSETAFISNEGGFLAKLRKSKRVMIEAQFYQRGGQQFVFETVGLVWK